MGRIVDYYFEVTVGRRTSRGWDVIVDNRRNEDILKEIKLDQVENKLRQYKQKYLYHISRIHS